MFFVLQKIIWFLILPPASLLVLITAGFVIGRKRRKAGQFVAAMGLALLYVLSIGPVADFLLRPLESSCPPLTNPRIVADAVVVPGGGTVDLAWMGVHPVPNGETGSRLVEGVRLAKRLKLPLVLSGGNGEPFSTELRDADVMASAAVRMGIRREQLIVENRSRNTLENSHAVRGLVKGNRIILATSAYYMGRAVTMFEKRGFTVMPAPVYFLSQTRKCNYSALIPGASHFARSTRALAEWISIVWWKVRGEI